MRESRTRTRTTRSAVATAAAGALLWLGCVTVDPYTGRQQVDVASTAAAVAALTAVGAIAYAASQDDDDHHHNRNWNRYYRPTRAVRCYPAQRACFDRYGYQAPWTRHEFDRRRR